MDLTIYAKQIEIKSTFDGYVEIELKDIDDDRFEYVDEDELITTAQEAVDKFGVEKILREIGEEKIMEHLDAED